MTFIRDFTISYIAGVVGALVVVFSLDGNNALQSIVFWFYFFVLYFVIMGIYDLLKLIKKKK